MQSWLHWPWRWFRTKWSNAVNILFLLHGFLLDSCIHWKGTTPTYSSILEGLKRAYGDWELSSPNMQDKTIYKGSVCCYCHSTASPLYAHFYMCSYLKLRMGNFGDLDSLVVVSVYALSLTKYFPSKNLTETYPDYPPAAWYCLLYKRDCFSTAWTKSHLGKGNKDGSRYG